MENLAELRCKGVFATTTGYGSVAGEVTLGDQIRLEVLANTPTNERFGFNTEGRSWSPLSHGNEPDPDSTVPSIAGVLSTRDERMRINADKISLINCQKIWNWSADGGMREVSNLHRSRDERLHDAEFWAEYAVIGDCHIHPDKEVVTEIRFVVDDGRFLFHDPKAFGSVNYGQNARQAVEHCIRQDAEQRRGSGRDEHACEIELGPAPWAIYFTGNRKAFSADTALGEVLAEYIFSVELDGYDGPNMKSDVCLRLVFPDAVNLKTAKDSAYKVIEFLGLMAGRPQNLTELWVVSSEKPAKPLRVYHNYSPKYDWKGDHEQKLQGEALVSKNHRNFSDVLVRWIDRDEGREHARFMFFDGFSQQRTVSVGRIINSANMFDLLPDDDIPPDIELTEDLRKIRDQCRDSFRELPQSPERNSILGALGRMGKSTLKKKIRHRAKIVVDKFGLFFKERETAKSQELSNLREENCENRQNFENRKSLLERELKEFQDFDGLRDLPKVTDLAVDFRNYYVHGTSSPKTDEEPRLLKFLVETLEFVFAVSDLIEAEWSVAQWYDKGHASPAHPFRSYLREYKYNTDHMNNLAENSESLS